MNEPTGPIARRSRTDEATQLVLRCLDELRDELTQSLQDVIRIPSVNPNYPGSDYQSLVGGETEANGVLERLYAAAGASTSWVEAAPGRANLVGTFAGSESQGRSLALNGHIDVVPPGPPEDWSHGGPFSGTVADGYIYGRGAADQKSGLVASGVAMLALRKSGVKLAGTVRLHSVVGEELGEAQLGTEAVVAAGHGADAAIVTEPTAAVGSDRADPRLAIRVAPVSAGHLWMTLEVSGKRGHNNLRRELVHAGGAGSRVGVNAIEKGIALMEGLQKLEREWGQTFAHPLFPPGHFSIHPGVIVGSPSGALVPFITPDVCRIEYSILYPPDIEGASIRADLEQFISDLCRLDPWLRDHPPAIRWNQDFPPSSISTRHELVTILAEILGKRGGRRRQRQSPIAAFDSLCDATYLNRLGIPSVVCGPGSIEFAHSIDERVRLDEVMEAARIYAMCAIRWCGLA